MNFFESKEAKKRRLLAQVEKLDRDCEIKQSTVIQARQLRAKIQLAKNKVSDLTAKINAAVNRPVEFFYDLNISGQISQGQLCQALLDKEIMSRHGAAIIKLAEKKLVEPAINASKQFEKANAEVLKGINLDAPDDSKFVPAAPINDAAIPLNLPSNEVRAMLGLKPGETLPSLAWEKINPNPGQIRDLDAD